MFHRHKSRSVIALLAGLILLSTLNYQSAIAVTGPISGFVNEGENFTLPVTLQPNTWYHMALVRDGANKETVWIDGARSTSGQQTDNRNYYSTATGINWAHCIWCVTGSSKFNGERITNLRVLVGTALYNTASATITVPTPPLTAIANNGATFVTGQ